MTAQTPRILEGPSPTVAMNSIEEFSIRTNGGDAERRLEALYRTGSADLVHGSGSEMFEALKVLRAANPQQYKPADGVQYPRSPFGQRLLAIAQLIKAGVGLEVAFADVGGWDTHVNQGGAQGQLANRLGDFAQSIAALVADLGDRMDDVVILTMSEFGRTVKQNGTGGTDHGHAGAMFVIAGALQVEPQGAGTVAGAGAGAVVRGTRPGADDGLPQRVQRAGGEASGRVVVGPDLPWLCDAGEELAGDPVACAGARARQTEHQCFKTTRQTST